MKLNYDTVLVGKSCLLVPYRKEHVEKYHGWMQDPALLEATGSEPLSIEEEYEMQETWRDDEAKCTFIVVQKGLLSETFVLNEDFIEQTTKAMVGDVNLFLSETDDHCPQAELDIMIAEEGARRKGIGKEASSMMMKFAMENLHITRFFCKINSENTASFALFRSMGFRECDYAECFQQYEYELIGEELKALLQPVSFEVQTIPRPGSECIYLDYNGTTPIYDEVLEAMMPYFKNHFGNPSSGHFFGRQPRLAVDQARRDILQLLEDPGGDLSSVWFTSCGTEADNLAIQLALQACQHVENPHIVTTNVEHPAITEALRTFKRRKMLSFTEVPVMPDGRVASQDVIASIQSNTVLVTVMLANNESGALMPVREVAQHCREAGILFHTDAAQAAGKVSVGLEHIGRPDMVTLVGHKFGAPKGIGCLYVRPGCLHEGEREVRDGGILLIGGSQEHGRRGGTENVPYIVGMGLAARMSHENLLRNSAHCEKLRTRLLDKLVEGIGSENIRVNGPASLADRLPNTLSIGIRNLHSGEFLSSVSDFVAASAGATCHSTESVSAVLQAMKVPHEFARGTLRLSVGPKTTESEIDLAASILVHEALKIVLYE